MVVIVGGKILVDGVIVGTVREYEDGVRRYVIEGGR